MDNKTHPKRDGLPPSSLKLPMPSVKPPKTPPKTGSQGSSKNDN